MKINKSMSVFKMKDGETAVIKRWLDSNSVYCNKRVKRIGDDLVDINNHECYWNLWFKPSNPCFKNPNDFIVKLINS